MRKTSVTFITALFFAVSTFAASADMNNGQNYKNSAGPKEDISVMAGQMLDMTNQARIAIKNGNTSAALSDVEKAQTDLRNVESRANGSTLIPVYQEFVSISILDPVKAEHQSRKANGQQSAEVVHQVAGDYTNMAVDTTVAQRNLAAAKTALQQKNAKLADKALADVQEGVEFNEVEASMPLARARENLILARASAEKNDATETKAALNSACKALTSYSEEGGPHAQQAKNLAQQIQSYEGNMQQNGTSNVAKINSWWNTTSTWTPYKSNQLNASR